MDTFIVTLNYPAGSRLSEIVVAGQTPVRRDDGKREQTYTRDALCWVVCALGSCAECDALGKQTCDKVKR